VNPLAEVSSLKHVLSQLQQALGCMSGPQHLVVQHPQQIQGMLNAALKHQSNLQEALIAEK